MLSTFLRFVLRVLLRVRVTGEIAALDSGRTLVVANYDSLLDGVLIGLFLPGQVTVAVTPAETRRPLLRLMLRAVRHVVVDASHPLALKTLMRRLERGQPVAVFPQGQPTVTGGLMKVYDSAALIAARCNAQIVPVRVSGTLYSRFSAVGGNFPRRLFPRVTLTVLPPQPLPALPPLQGKAAPAAARGRDAADHAAHDVRLAAAHDAVREPARCRGAARLFARRILEDTQGEHTYRGIVKASLALGRLACRLAEEREIVGVMMPNLAATVALLLGLSAMRRVPAMLNYTAGPEALRSACIAAGIKTVITSRRFVSAGAARGGGRGAVHRAHRLSRGPARALRARSTSCGCRLGAVAPARRDAAAPIPATRRSCSSPPAPRRGPRASR